MPDREFKIKITGDASGLTAASKEAASALQQDGQITEELSRKTGFLSLKKTELKKIVRELGQEFPIAGMAARAMLNPIVFAFTAAISIFGAAKAKLDEWNKSMDDAAARAASPDFKSGMDARKASLEGAATGAAAFATALENIGRAEDLVKGKFQEAIDKLHEFTNAQAEINSAAEARDLAKVDLARKTGKISEMDAIMQRGAIRERYRKAQDEAKTKAEQQELGLQEHELGAQREGLPGLVGHASTARRERDELKARVAQAQKDLEEGLKKAPEYDAAVAKAGEAVDKATPWYQRAQRVAGFFGFKLPKDQADRARYEKAAAALESARADKARQDALNQRNTSFINDAGQVMPYADAEATLWDTRAQDSAKRISQLELTLPGKREALSIREQGRDVAGGFQDQAARMGVIGQVADQYAPMAGRFAKAAGQGDISGMAGALAALVSWPAQMNELIQALRQGNHALMDTVQSFKAEQAQLKSQLGNIRSR